jgi:glycosyltransferase involved in cell wall biosynthesis
MPLRKVRVLHTIRQGKIGGGESHILSIAEKIDQSIFEPLVLSFSDGEMIDRLVELKVRHFVIPTEKPFNVFAWSKVKEIIQKEEIDIVHAHGTRACSNSYKSALELKKPLIYTIHGWSFHSGQSRMVRKLRQTTESYLCGKTNLNICVSESNEEEGKKLFGLQNSVVIKNGIDLDKFNPDLKYKDLRADLHFSSQTILVAYIARLTAQKDPFTFLHAIKIVVSKTENIEFIIAGDGDLKEQTIQLAKELEIDAYVKFLDARNDIPDILKAVDIYCLPSLWEGLPLGVLEAMAMKKATIASAVDGTKEVLITGENGLLIEPKNARQISDAIILLANDIELRRNLGENGRKTVQAHYDVRQMINHLQYHYLQFANGS